MSSIHSYYGASEVKAEPNSIIQAHHKWENERLLLRVIQEKLGITDEDMRTPDVVKQKLRDANIEEIIN